MGIEPHLTPLIHGYLPAEILAIRTEAFVRAETRAIRIVVHIIVESLERVLL